MSFIESLIVSSAITRQTANSVSQMCGVTFSKCSEVEQQKETFIDSNALIWAPAKERVHNVQCVMCIERADCCEMSDWLSTISSLFFYSFCFLSLDFLTYCRPAQCGSQIFVCKVIVWRRKKKAEKTLIQKDDFLSHVTFLFVHLHSADETNEDQR